MRKFSSTKTLFDLFTSFGYSQSITRDVVNALGSDDAVAFQSVVDLEKLNGFTMNPSRKNNCATLQRAEIYL